MAVKKWDGKGKPPSRKAAVEWLVKEADFTREAAEKVVGTTGTLTKVGENVRKAAGPYRKLEDGLRLPKVDIRDLPDPLGTSPYSSGSGGGEPTASGRATDTNRDGTVSAEEILEQAQTGDVSLDDIDLGELPTGAALGSRGSALLPVPTSPEDAASLRLPNRSTEVQARRFDHGGGDQTVSRTTMPIGGDVGVRYYESDLLEPLRWSAERRADLQRVLQGIGLYGDHKVQLGSWGDYDTDLYAKLLETANVNGLKWHEQLAAWKKSPPADLLDAVAGAGGGERAPLVVRTTNPLDIAQTAEEVSRGLIGRVDRDFAEGTVAPYQGLETGAQTAAYNAAEDGGTVTDAPSVQGFVEDKLRREQPIEVDGYEFLNQFQQFMSMLGVQ